MKNLSNNSHIKKVSVLRIANLTIILAIFISSSFLTPNSNNNAEIDRDLNNFSQIPLLADTDSILFEGNEISLNITDYGNLYDANQDVSLSNQEELNLSYYLDEVHDWKVSKIETQVDNIQDTRDWVNNSDFIKNVTVYRKSVDLHNIDPPGNPVHNYDDDLDEDPTNPANIHSKIYQNDALAIRVHFDIIDFEDIWDCVFIWDKYDKCYYSDTGYRTNFYSPWILGEGINITIGSDDWSGSTEYGYHIDYYEYVNASSGLSENLASWSNYTNTNKYNYGSGWIGNNTAMYTALYSYPNRIDHSDYFSADYTKGNYSEIYQNLTIPRGKVIDAYISFDYYAEFAMESNDNYIYLEINNNKVYTLGLRDVVEAGRYKWHHTGQINMDLWVNTSNIFNNPIYNQKINISVGIMSGASVSYSGFQDAYQQVIWFDNLSLILTTIANSSQDGINLLFNKYNINQGEQWGQSYLDLNGTCAADPVTLTVNTTSPSLSFELDTILYGYHDTTSRIGQSTLEGVSYEILENGSIYWYFSHNLFMPSQYSNFEFIISKPKNWEFIYALDPTLQSRPFENGALGDSDLKINKSNALFPGWWSFKATSPNYLDIANTMMLKQGEWTHTSFDTGESTRIKSQVNYSSEIPNNIESTEVNLTIFDPEGHQWYSEVKSPLSNGTVLFSEITFSALNTIGGQFEYTLLWSNGTALGGLKSSFIVNHQSQINLLKPDDAKSGLTTYGFVGDIIPVRVILTDKENNLSISNAIVSYNWTSGSTLNFTEAAIGIYETILDTADLSSRGLYEILISSSKLGFFESNLTLKIDLGEETNLQRLEF